MRQQQLMKELEDTWWRMWITQALPFFVHYKKWRTVFRNLCVDDIVLVLYDRKVGKADYHLDRILEGRYTLMSMESSGTLLLACADMTIVKLDCLINHGHLRRSSLESSDWQWYVVWNCSAKKRRRPWTLKIKVVTVI